MLTVFPCSTGLGDMARESALSFGVNWGAFVSQLICFLIVAILLQRFVFRPILKLLDERSKRIAEGLANTEQTEKELEVTRAARDSVLEMARLEAERILSEARTNAAEFLVQERRQAEILRMEIMEQARKEGLQQQELLRARMRDELADLIVEASMMVTSRILTEADREKLVREAARNLAA